MTFRSDSVIKALLSISLSKKIIPECLRLGDTCFTHMTTFGTVGKPDGLMPIHFDERDAISCVFHLGHVTKGGATQYYDGIKKTCIGKNIFNVPFEHGTLQVGIFSEILHGVQEWEGQRCGIQLNIKKDVLKHFVSYGSKFYNKYRYSKYPNGPVIFY